MQIPSEIMIAEHIVKIGIYKDCRRIQSSGEYNNWYREIMLNMEGTPEDVQAETFLHEIHESINRIFNLELDHKTLTLLSEILFQTIRRNKLNFVNP